MVRFLGTMTAAALFAVSAVSGAHAATLTDLYNTGLGPAGAALAPGDGQIDANYAVIASVVNPADVGNQARTYYNGAYLAENAGSRWISYSGSPFTGAGMFELSTTFDLTGFDPTTASISGMWGVDNEGEIFLNGVTTGFALLGTTVNNFNQLYAFTLNSGFVSGLNTLSFRVNDTGVPAALRVDGLTGSATAVNSAVPEPATWALMIVGFGAVGGAMRYRRRKLSVSYS